MKSPRLSSGFSSEPWTFDVEAFKDFRRLGGQALAPNSTPPRDVAANGLSLQTRRTGATEVKNRRWSAARSGPNLEIRSVLFEDKNLQSDDNPTS